MSEAQVEAPHSVSLGRHGRTVGGSKRRIRGPDDTDPIFTFFGLKTFSGPKTTHAMHTFALHLSQSHVKVPEPGLLPIMVSYNSSTENSAWSLVSGRMAEPKLSLKGRGQRAEGSRGMGRLGAGESGSRGSGRETGASVQVQRVLKAEVREGHARGKVYSSQLKWCSTGCRIE